MKFLTPTLLALLGVGLSCDTEQDCSEQPTTLQHYEDGNEGVGVGNQWEGHDNRWIGDQNSIYGHRNSLIGNQNEVFGHSNMIKGHGNRISGKRNTIKGKGNTIRGQNNVVSNSINDKLSFDIESRFPAWMRSGASSNENSRKSQVSGSKKQRTGKSPRFVEVAPPTYDEDQQTDQDNFIITRPRANRWFMNQEQQIPAVTQQRGRSRGRSNSSRSSRNRSNSGSALRESLRKRIQRQINSEFSDFEE